MILADSLKERVEVLKNLKEVQKQDFKFMYEAAKGKATTIRLLDPHCTNSYQKVQTSAAK